MSRNYLTRQKYKSLFSLKKTAVSFCLLFTIGWLHAGEPAFPEKENSADNKSFASSSKLNLDDDFIYPAWGFYFDFSPGISNIKNSNLSSTVWDSKKGLGFTFNVGYFHSLSAWFKLKSGIGITNYKNTLTADTDLPSQNFKDIDNDSYTEILTLTNIEKKSSPLYISVPLIFEFGNPNIEKIGFYADLGLKYSYLLNESYSSSGTYSTKGTYQQYNVTLENIPELGFYTNKTPEKNAGLKKSNFSLVAGAGVFIPLSSTIIFKGGLVTNIGLADIGNNTPANPNSNVINDNVYSYRSRYIDNTLAVVKGSRTFHFGIEFGVYISHRLK